MSIQLWYARAAEADPGDLERYCEAALTDEELAAAQRYRRQTSRNQHVVGRGMARRLLAGMDVPPQAIEFSFNAHGKPTVTAPAQCQRPFNVAHTEGMVVFATGNAHSIGIDVERLSRRTSIEVASRYFAESETAYVMSRNTDDDRRRAFLQTWTLKEAFIKAIGRGLSIPLADFAFTEIASACPRLQFVNRQWGNPAQWQFATAMLDDEYLVAIATDASDRPEIVPCDYWAYQRQPSRPA